MASKFVGVSFGKALRAALPIYGGVPGDDLLHDLFPKVVLWLPKHVIRNPSVLQVAGGHRVYLPELRISPLVVPAKAGTHTPRLLVLAMWQMHSNQPSPVLWVPAFAGRPGEVAKSPRQPSTPRPSART